MHLPVQQIGILRRGGGPEGQESLLILRYGIDQEQGGVPQNGQRALLQKRPVPGIDIMLSHMSAQPGKAQRPPAIHDGPRPMHSHRRCLAPQVRVVADRRAAGVKGFLRHVSSGDPQPVQQIEQRLMSLGKVADLRRPVIHFCVDIDRVITAPRRLHPVIPDTLQVEGLRARTGAADQQVPAEAVEQHGQGGVLLPGRVPPKALIRRQVLPALSPDLNRLTVHQCAEVRGMLRQQRVPGQLLRRLQIRHCQSRGVLLGQARILIKRLKVASADKPDFQHARSGNLQAFPVIICLSVC